MRVAIPCKFVNLSGGLFRFERVGIELAKRGHQMAYVALSSDTRLQRPSRFPVMTLDEAEQGRWDAVMLPGAGMGAAMEPIERLTNRNFGVRLQHVLNDRTRADRFAKLNRVFRPDRVIFNNRDWTPGSFTQFQAASFHILEGAVDTAAFRPTGSHRPIRTVGGLANKNPTPIIEACARLGMSVRLFGTGNDLPSPLPAHVDWIGPQFGQDLAAFYASVDVVVHTEEMAGWANLVAEAMSSEVPVICTRAGTWALAEHEVTALLIEKPSVNAIAAALQRLVTEPGLSREIARRARTHVEQYNWSDYTDALVELCAPPPRAEYLWAPEWGLHGKWPLETRLHGLEPLFAVIAGTSVLDLGCAEGFLSRLCLEAGASLVHGVEIDSSRVEEARSLCASYVQAEFWTGDLANWEGVVGSGSDAALQTMYDMVLYLGVHHHLPPATRRSTLVGAAALARRQFAVRTSIEAFEGDDVGPLLSQLGFSLAHRCEPGPGAGPLWIFERANCAS